MLTPVTRSDQTILATASLLLAATFCLGLITPPLFILALAAAIAAGLVFVAFCFPTVCCVVWLVVAGMSLEMTLGDVVGPEAYQPTIAIVKGMEIGLAFLAMVRFGPRLDPLSPAWAFLAITAAGMMHDSLPDMTTMDTLRSMIGSVSPFVFSFCRMPRSWAEAMIRATKWCPIIAVAACLPLAAVGIRPLFVEGGGARLAGLGHPAFLAGVCMTAIYACLIQLYREGRRGDLILLIANFLILILTGARAPFTYAIAVTGGALLTIRSGTFALRDRLMLVLGTLALLPALGLLAGDVTDIRLFNVMLNETSNLSGRDLLWPLFEQAAALSPWFGWGIGAGNVIISPEAAIARLLGTRAAHNEYLRIQVEGGLIGEALLIAMFAGWAIAHTRGLCASDRRIMRFVFLALAGHVTTDNVLISTAACVLFAFSSAVFARGIRE